MSTVGCWNRVRFLGTTANRSLAKLVQFLPNTGCCDFRPILLKLLDLLRRLRAAETWSDSSELQLIHLWRSLFNFARFFEASGSFASTTGCWNLVRFLGTTADRSTAKPNQYIASAGCLHYITVTCFQLSGI